MFFSHLPIYVLLVNLFANLNKIKIPCVSGSLVKLSEIKVSCELYCLFHIYLSMCWSIFLQIWIRSRFHVLVGLLWNLVRSMFLVNCIAFFMSTYRCVGQSFYKFKYNQGSMCLWVSCEIEWDQSFFLVNCWVSLVKQSQDWGSWIGKCCFTYQLSISY